MTSRDHAKIDQSHIIARELNTVAQKIVTTIKNNNWIVLVGAFAILIVIGIAVS